MSVGVRAPGAGVLAATSVNRTVEPSQMCLCVFAKSAMNTRNALLVLDYLVLLVLLYSSMVVLVVVVVVLWDILASVWFLLFALNRLSEAPDLLEHVRN